MNVDNDFMYEKSGVIYQISDVYLEAVQAGKIHITDNVLSPLKNGIMPGQRFVIFNLGSNQLCDLDFKFIPLPYCFGYCNGSIVSSKYDLKKALEYLKHHPNVVDKENIGIEMIPYYQDEDGYYIYFKYLPTQEEYEKLQGTHVLSRFDVIIHDFLHLDNFRLPPKKDEE